MITKEKWLQVAASIDAFQVFASLWNTDRALLERANECYQRYSKLSGVHLFVKSNMLGFVYLNLVRSIEILKVSCNKEQLISLIWSEMMKQTSVSNWVDLTSRYQLSLQKFNHKKPEDSKSFYELLKSVRNALGHMGYRIEGEFVSLVDKNREGEHFNISIPFNNLLIMAADFGVCMNNVLMNNNLIVDN